MTDNSLDLYEMLPMFWRLQDAERGEPLKALLSIIARQADIVKRDIDGLYDDFFIETSADWVIPYIGALVDNNPLHELEPGGLRADVAKTIYYRRRKGTLPMLEELARDVTGWRAHVLDSYENLGWTQHVNHIRAEAIPSLSHPHSFARVGTVNLRQKDDLEKLEGPFDRISHSVDVRPTDRTVGRYNLHKIIFFFWRLKPYTIQAVPAKRSAVFADGFSISALGAAKPVFTKPLPENDEYALSSELDVPGPIRPGAFHRHTADYYGPGLSLALYRGSATPVNLIPRSSILCKDLSGWSAPPPGKVAVDVRLGRVAFAPGEAPARLMTSHTYAFSADIGGGPYLRGALEESAGLTEYPVGKGLTLKTLQAALSQWVLDGKPHAVITIQDNQRYGGPVQITMPKDGLLIIRAAEGCRPLLNYVAKRNISAPDGDARVMLDGLLIEGSLKFGGDLKVFIRHCTFVPGRMLLEDGSPRFPDLDSLSVDTSQDFSDLAVDIRSSILGPIRMPAECEGLKITDSIVDALPVGGAPQPAIAADDLISQPGPPTELERCTIFGEVFVREVHASNTIFNARLRVERLQEGCARFCYLPEGSETPRRFECQPDLALAKTARQAGYASLAEAPDALYQAVSARLVPIYTSTHYGDAAYAQLDLECALEICTGAEDGSEIGVYASLKQPQREINLRIRLEEYLPFGLEPGLVYVT